MGRMIVFSEVGCSASTKLESCLKAHGLPYSLINLTHYPAKRADMAALCMRMNTPQVFFNTRHVGGADETMSLLRKWERKCHSDDEGSSRMFSSDMSITSHQSKKSSKSKNSKKNKLLFLQSNDVSTNQSGYASVYERFMDEVGQHNDPVDARLALPNPGHLNIATSHRLARTHEAEHCIQLPGNDTSTVLEMTEVLKDLLKTSSNKVYGVTYHRSFFGYQVTEVLQRVFCVSVNEGSLLAEQLLQCGIFLSAEDEADEEVVVFEEGRLYRLQCQDTPTILNSFRLLPVVMADSADPDYTRMLHGLIDMLQIVQANVMDNEGNVDLKKAVKLPQFNVFENAVCELQGVDLDDMDDKAKLAFGINVYNIMVTYAMMKHGTIPDDGISARLAFFSSFQFFVGQNLYSFNDWEHGILRGNAKPPNSLTELFSKSDPRFRYVVNSPDPRIHFALNRGTRACPSIVRYTAKNLEKELAIAASAFCEVDANVKFDKDMNELHLAQIFRTYRSDFTISEKYLPQIVVNYMKGTKKREKLERAVNDYGKTIKIAYRLQDLKGNSYLRGKAFDPAALKTEDAKRIAKMQPSSPRKSPTRRSKFFPRLVRSPSSAASTSSCRSLDS